MQHVLDPVVCRGGFRQVSRWAPWQGTQVVGRRLLIWPRENFPVSCSRNKIGRQRLGTKLEGPWQVPLPSTVLIQSSHILHMPTSPIAEPESRAEASLGASRE